MLSRVSNANWAFEADERPQPHWQVLGYRRYLKARPVERSQTRRGSSWPTSSPTTDERPSSNDLRQYLVQEVPFYMLPAAFVILDRLPTTDSGKIHRAALPDPGAADGQQSVARASTPPRTARERALLDAWRAALPTGEIGIDDNFFAAGGDSIRAIRVVATAADAGVRLSVQDLYLHQTIRELAAAVEDRAPALAAGTAASAPEDIASAPEAVACAQEAGARIADSDRARLPHDIEDAYALARMQAGLIYHSEQHPQSPVYRASFLYRFDGPLDPAAFAAAARDLVDHHPILRTAFDLARVRRAAASRPSRRRTEPDDGRLAHPRCGSAGPCDRGLVRARARTRLRLHASTAGAVYGSPSLAFIVHGRPHLPRRDSRRLEHRGHPDRAAATLQLVMVRDSRSFRRRRGRLIATSSRWSARP